MAKINEITKEQWKAARTAANIEKTSWYKGSGPSVGSKLEAWQTARTNAKVILTKAKQANYAMGNNDDKILKTAYTALKDLSTALADMLKKVKEQKPRTPELETFQKTVQELHDQAEKKKPKWKTLSDEWKTKVNAERVKIINEIFS